MVPTLPSPPLPSPNHLHVFTITQSTGMPAGYPAANYAPGQGGMQR